MEVKVKRKRNTGDTTQDINLDYSYSYDMHAAIGKMSDTSDQALLFAAQAVDFTKFTSSTTGAFYSLTSGVAILAAIYSMTF